MKALIAYRRRAFSTSIEKSLEAEVCIVGSGPVGMVLSNMLNRFKVSNIVIEKYPSLQGIIMHLIIFDRTSEGTLY